MIPDTIVDLIRLHGANSTSFQTLYPGYQYFSAEIAGELGVVAYVNTAFSWVGAAEPVISEGNTIALLEAFRNEARQHGKVATLLPVSEKIAKLVRARGWYAVQIGNEPWYELKKDRNHAGAKQLVKKGARVERFEPNSIGVGQKIELDELTSRWLESRKMANLAFLNRVEPWHWFNDRRYYRITYRNRQIAYLAAVPVQSRNSWYFVDLIRDSDSPAGTTELLVIEAAKQLEAEGAGEFTLGMSPFADPDPAELAQHPFIYKLFSYFFHQMETLYGFKSLFQYKHKFNADHWEPQFLVALDQNLGPRSLMGIGRAIFPKGYVHTAVVTLSRMIGRFDLTYLCKKVLNERMVPKSPPRSFLLYLSRCKITLSMVGLTLLYFFVSTDEHFHIRQPMLSRYSYSLENFVNGSSPTRGFIDLVIASFLHWDVLHVSTNIVIALFTMSFLECLFGSTLTFMTYLAGILFTNPLTSLSLSGILYFFSPAKLGHFFHEPDIGISLGIFSCIGTLAVFVKKPVFLLGIFALATLIYNVQIQSYLGYNHLVALCLGYWIGNRYAKLA